MGASCSSVGRTGSKPTVSSAATVILARIIEVSDLEAELIELDENLERTALTVLERGEYLLRRKEIYEQLHPETKHGGAPGKKGGGKEAKDATVASFAEDTASKTNLSGRTIQDDVKIARLGDDTKKAIRGTRFEDQKRVLLQITRIAPEKQAAVAEAVASGRCHTVKQAAIELGVTTERPSRPPNGDIKARVREVAQPLREARQRLARLVRDIEPALVQGAQAIGEELEALEKKFAALMRSASVPTKAASLDQAQAGAISRETGLPLVSTPEGVVGNDKHAPTRTGVDLYCRLLDAKSHFSKRHGGLLDGSTSYAECMEPYRGDPESERVAREALGRDLLALARELSSFSIEVPDWMRGPRLRRVNGAGNVAPAPRGPSRAGPSDVRCAVSG